MLLSVARRVNPSFLGKGLSRKPFQLRLSSKRGISSKGPSTNSNGILAWYMHQLETKPLVTKSLTSATLVASGDILSQLCFEDGKFDFARLGRMFILGGVLIGPSLHIWYGMLSKYIPSPTTQGALMRLAADQLIFAPLFIPVVFVCISAMEGKLSEIKSKLDRDFMNALIANWQLWVPTNFINFRFVPVQFQVLFANGVSIIWNSYVSYIGHKSLEDEKKVEHK